VLWHSDANKVKANYSKKNLSQCLLVQFLKNRPVLAQSVRCILYVIMHYYIGIQACIVQGNPARMDRYLIPTEVKQISHLISPNPRKNNGFNNESKCPNFKVMYISNIVSGNVRIKTIKQMKRTASLCNRRYSTDV
jgi:hypothetical protein